MVEAPKQRREQYECIFISEYKAKQFLLSTSTTQGYKQHIPNRRHISQAEGILLLKAKPIENQDDSKRLRSCSFASDFNLRSFVCRVILRLIAVGRWIKILIHYIIHELMTCNQSLQLVLGIIFRNCTALFQGYIY